ncbi:MAG: hypothetical protein A2Z18_00575, partial [Armatimonadetes bacterium RBG_16_58_9]
MLKVERRDCLCVGHAAHDISVFVSEYPRENSKGETQLVIECGGGPAANAVYSLSTWGKRCAFAGLVGDDSYGLRVISEFESAATDISLLELRSGYPTPLSVILVNEQNGSRTIVNRKISESPYRPDASALARIEPKVLLFDGHELEASLDTLAAFPDAVSILDAGSLREGTDVLSRKVGYLVASERFAMQVSGLSDLNTDEHRREALRQLRARNDGTVVITLGERGLIYDSGIGPRYLP